MNQGSILAWWDLPALACVFPSSDGSLLLTSASWSYPLSALWGMKSVFIMKGVGQKELTAYLIDYKERSPEGFSPLFQPNQKPIYDIQTGQKTLTLNNPGLANNYKRNCATFNPTDDLVLNDGVMWDVRSAQAIHKFDKFNMNISGVFHPNGLEVIINTEIANPVLCYQANPVPWYQSNPVPWYQVNPVPCYQANPVPSYHSSPLKCLVFLNESQWDLRTYHLLHTVPALDQCRIVFNNNGTVIYGAMLQADDEDDMMDQQMKSPFGSSFRTFDATDYKPIERLLRLVSGCSLSTCSSELREASRAVHWLISVQLFLSAEGGFLGCSLAALWRLLGLFTGCSLSSCSSKLREASQAALCLAPQNQDSINMDTVCRLYEVGRQRLAEEEEDEEDQEDEDQEDEDEDDEDDSDDDLDDIDTDPLLAELENENGGEEDGEHDFSPSDDEEVARLLDADGEEEEEEEEDEDDDEDDDDDSDDNDDDAELMLENSECRFSDGFQTGPPKCVSGAGFRRVHPSVCLGQVSDGCQTGLPECVCLGQVSDGSTQCVSGAGVRRRYDRPECVCLGQVQTGPPECVCLGQVSDGSAQVCVWGRFQTGPPEFQTGPPKCVSGAGVRRVHPSVCLGQVSDGFQTGPPKCVSGADFRRVHPSVCLGQYGPIADSSDNSDLEDDIILNGTEHRHVTAGEKPSGKRSRRNEMAFEGHCVGLTQWGRCRLDGSGTRCVLQSETEGGGVWSYVGLVSLTAQPQYTDWRIFVS
ncbi:hypothetical protein JZ751_027242 [Albula glossodonta]|uniref:Uncharacterized protein n=1 Tax=Albula glossodonta TaxID=121402 RepID=A0A8T2MSH5_9TELE|nr:hypothetical protein JZ751_027242 [Albula glossodonta]